MDTEAIWRLFEPLYEDIRSDDQFPDKRPVLAHYTSLDVLEKILRTNELWFSNPLFMNDFEEVRFGIWHGVRALRESKEVREALGNNERYATFVTSLDHHINYFEREHLLDTYVFCLSEHPRENRDGLLSMWRGYGGNGKGAALVFDTANLSYVDPSPMFLAPVHYGSSEERYTWCGKTASIFASVLTRNQVPNDQLHLASAAVFERIKLFALCTKHHGFREESEWRVVYMRERDTGNRLKSMLHYFNGPRGIEPKLRFQLASIDGVTGPDFSFDKLLWAILLGPSMSSPLAFRSVARMLEVIDKPGLKDRLYASSIPFRMI